MKKKSMKILVILVLSLALLGCFAGTKTVGDNPAGFFLGIWHGWIAPFALILEIFSSEIRIYEPYNRGFLYDLGFYIAIISGFGTISIFRNKQSK